MNNTFIKAGFKKILTLVTLFLILIFVFLYWRYRQRLKLKGAEDFAQAYMNGKLSTEIFCDSVQYDIVEQIYFIKFHTVETPTINFMVYVVPKKDSSGYRIWKDDYNEMYCEYLLTEYLSPGIEKIWKNITRIAISMNWNNTMEEEFTGFSKPIDRLDDSLKAFLRNKYRISLYLPYSSDKVQKIEEAERILELINKLKEDKILPTEIRLRFSEPDNPSSSPSPFKYRDVLSFGNLDELLTVEDVLDKMQEA